MCCVSHCMTRQLEPLCFSAIMLFPIVMSLFGANTVHGYSLTLWCQGSTLELPINFSWHYVLWWRRQVRVSTTLALYVHMFADRFFFIVLCTFDDNWLLVRALLHQVTARFACYRSICRSFSVVVARFALLSNFSEPRTCLAIMRM